MNINEVTDRNIYGTIETNGLINGPDYHKVDRESVDWTEKGLRITRLRLLTDRGHPMYDVSYCHGILNGQPVDVQLPFSQIPKKTAIPFLIKQGRDAGVFAKGIGILDQGNWSILK